jgi:four helix bundle suffix protein
MERPLFDKSGGFRRLHSFTLATVIRMETRKFCRRFMTYNRREQDTKYYDPTGRQYDQMTQAARSGKQNIIEGSERSATSKDTEIKLTDVARASLGELRGDFEDWILDKGACPWSVHSPEAKAVNAILVLEPTFEDDMVHESAKHAFAQRALYAKWLDSDDDLVVANAMLIIIGRAMKLLDRQMEAQGQAFEAGGGFNERMMTRRLAAREVQRDADAPVCPKCEKPMRKRRSAKGEFWGCSDYPQCRGTLPVETPHHPVHPVPKVPTP